MFSVAANCASCKVLASQVFYNNKKERICADCIQKEYEQSCEKLHNSNQKNKELEQKIVVYDAILEQIKNFAQLVKKE